MVNRPIKRLMFPAALILIFFGALLVAFVMAQGPTDILRQESEIKTLTTSLADMRINVAVLRSQMDDLRKLIYGLGMALIGNILVNALTLKTVRNNGPRKPSR